MGPTDNEEVKLKPQNNRIFGMAKVNSDLSSKLGFLSIGCSSSDVFKKGHRKEYI